MHCEVAQFQGRVYIHILKLKNWKLTALGVSEPLHVPHQNIFIYAQDIPKAMLKVVDLQDKIKISLHKTEWLSRFDAGSGSIFPAYPSPPFSTPA